MKYYEISIDEQVYLHLQSKAVAFKDSPNDVLRTILFKPVKKLNSTMNFSEPKYSLPSYQHGTPQALEQILNVIFLVKEKKLSRVKATNVLSNILNVSSTTIIDKYTRQLGLKAHEFENLIEHNLYSLRKLLIDKFPVHIETIQNAFNTFGYKVIETASKSSKINLTNGEFTLDRLVRMNADQLVNSKPLSLRLNDQLHFVSNWTDLTLKVFNWIVDNRRISASNLPILVARGRGRQKYFVNSRDEHSSKSLDGYWHNVHDYYIDTKYNVDRILSNIASMLKQLNITNLEIKVAVRFDH